MPEELTQEKQLDYVLQQLDNSLIEWGLDNWLGFRTAETMRLSVSGATNLLDLVNVLSIEISRLNDVVTELENSKQ